MSAKVCKIQMMFFWQITFQLQPLHSVLMVVTNTYSHTRVYQWAKTLQVSPHLLVYHLHKWAKSLFNSLSWRNWRSFSFPLSHVSEPIEINQTACKCFTTTSWASSAELHSVVLQAFVLPQEICAAMESWIRYHEIKSNFSFMVQIQIQQLTRVYSKLFITNYKWFIYGDLTFQASTWRQQWKTAFQKVGPWWRPSLKVSTFRRDGRRTDCNHISDFIRYWMFDTKSLVSSLKLCSLYKFYVLLVWFHVGSISVLEFATSL